MGEAKEPKPMTQELDEWLGALDHSICMKDRMGEFPACGVLPQLHDVLKIVGTYISRSQNTKSPKIFLEDSEKRIFNIPDLRSLQKCLESQRI